MTRIHDDVQPGRHTLYILVPTGLLEDRRRTGGVDRGSMVTVISRPIDATRRWLGFGATVAAAIGLIAALMVVAPVSAAPPQPVVIPNNGSLLGLGYGGLSVAWQKFVNGQPAATNPLLDATGRNCAVGQHGPVFFLVGGFGPSKVNRDCTVPAGKLLYFPLVNCNWIHVPLDVPGIGDDKTTVDEVWAALQSPTEGCGPRDNASGLSASVDKVAINNLDPSTTPYYVCAGPRSQGCTAPAFSLTFPADNLFTSFGVPLPAGTYFPVVADGYYLLLAPLRPGVHTIAFGGSAGVAPNAFTQDITYTLRVTDSD